MICLSVKKNKMNKRIVLSFVLLALVLGAMASFPEKTRPDAWVNDYADILDPSSENYLNRKLGAYEDSTSTQFFIVTLGRDMHEGKPIEMMGAEIGEEWGVGQRGKDNGLVIVVYPEERNITIQTGYGLEQYIPDAIAKRIIEKEVLPNFRNNDYAKGLDQATNIMMGLLSGQFTADQYREQTSSGAAPFGFIIPLILFFLIFGRSRRRRHSTLGGSLPFWVAMGMLGGSQRGGWSNFSSGSGGFGGFSGGGGGSFGGGGASGSW